MKIETVAIRLPVGMDLRDWLAEHTVAPVPPTPAERTVMERVAARLEAKGPIGRRKDREDAIELRFGGLRITVVAHGALIVERLRTIDLVSRLTGLTADDLWYGPVLTIESGLVLYDPESGQALPPPGVDLGPEPYAPPLPARRRLLRRAGA